MANGQTSSFFPQAIGPLVAIIICFAATDLAGLGTTPQIPNWYADLGRFAWPTV